MEMRFVDTDYLIRTDWNDIKLSTFAETFDRIWKDKMKEGIFKYKINFLKAKMLGGNFQFFAQLNIERAMKRRAPQILSSLTQPFDDKVFNFTKLHGQEFMFHVVHNSLENGSEKIGNYIAINASPLEFGHSLLLPALFEKLPQILTFGSIEFAICTLLSNHNPAFRIGFNSLCAYASVNHLHLHAYYLKQPMLLEWIEVNHLSGNCYVLEKHPSKGYVFEIKALVDIHPIIRDIYKLTNFFTENKIAHNMYVTYGLCFERARFLERTTERDCIRIYIWARTYSQAEESYNQLTEEKVAEILENITHAPFNATKHKVQQLFAKVK
ncbi:GDP-D-glucose phosphorylase 1 isoform X2 [Rhodnius prolixus]|uniref:GDP-D-glucose phosphorylase 1 isoform X2 n=1 Tax=Rhodnius prolixus TaxID=13249 RepID=UPI003D18B8A8